MQIGDPMNAFLAFARAGHVAPRAPAVPSAPSPGQQKGIAMAIGILAAVLGLLFGTAAIVIPRIVNRHNDPDDHSDSQAYLANTGRSAEEIVQGNHSMHARPDSDAGSPHAGGADTGKPG